MFRGMLKIEAKGPRAFNISLRFLVSSLLIAPIRGAVTRYIVRKIIVPRIKVIQLVVFRRFTTAYVIVAEVIDAVIILIDDLKSTVAL